MKMTEKLKDYQVLDVLRGGTFYKVRHKVTDNIFTWKAFNCSAYSDEQIQNVVNEVKTISRAAPEGLLRYYDTILHAPSKTLYFVVEYTRSQTLEDLITVCDATDKHFAEGFVWRLLATLARVCKALESFNFLVLQKCITPSTIYVDAECSVRVDCVEVGSGAPPLVRQVGGVARALVRCAERRYSDDLRDIVALLTGDRGTALRVDALLHHPTLLANLETLPECTLLRDILVATDYCPTTSDVNKCDSQKAVDLCRTIEPAPRTRRLQDSPIYSNVIRGQKVCNEVEESNSVRNSLSPTVAALALELPGFVPRSRRPISKALETYTCPQRVSEETLSQQWMTRLIALRQREESLNKRERDLIAKEIVNSPAAKIVALDDSENVCESNSNGITLPPMIKQVDPVESEYNPWMARRRHRRSSSGRAKPRRKSYAHEDLDSSLSADNGDGSIIITATKFTAQNMPRRNIFPDSASKKVHFTPVNPFVESDESVTLTFYELENVDKDGYQVPRNEEKVLKDITKFKYLDLEKMTSEKRAAMPQWKCSPSKQAKTGSKILGDITNSEVGLRKTPSKTSLTSRGSSTRFSMISGRSEWSMESDSKVSEGCISYRTRSSTRQSLAATPAPPDKKTKSRKSLLPFKTPFKFKTSTKV